MKTPCVKTLKFPYCGAVLHLPSALAIILSCTTGCLFAVDAPATEANPELSPAQIKAAPLDAPDVQTDTPQKNDATPNPVVELPRYAQVPLEWNAVDNSGLRPGITCTYDRDTHSFRFEHVSLQGGGRLDSAATFIGQAALAATETKSVATEPATPTTWHFCIDVSDSSRNAAVKEQISASCELIRQLPPNDRVLVYALGQSLQPWGIADNISSRGYLIETLTGYAKTKNFGLDAAIRGESLIFFRLRDIVNSSASNAHILLFSDGCDESLDSENMKRELIKAAHNKGIGISGIAYAGGKGTGSKGFNNVQDLASATRGAYTEASPDKFIVSDLSSFASRMAEAGHPACYSFSVQSHDIPHESIKVILQRDGAPAGCVYLPKAAVDEAVRQTTIIEPEAPEEPEADSDGAIEVDAAENGEKEKAGEKEEKAEPAVPAAKPEETVTIASWTISRNKFNTVLYIAGGLLLSLILLLVLLLLIRRRRARRAAVPKAGGSAEAYGTQESVTDGEVAPLDRYAGVYSNEALDGSGLTVPIALGGGTRPLFDITPTPQVSLDVSVSSDGSSITAKIGKESRTFLITKDTVLIGSDFSCDLVLQDQTVSKSHCVLKKDSNGKWRLTDLGSTNKIYYAGRLHDALIVNDGDTVELGNVFLQFNLK